MTETNEHFLKVGSWAEAEEVLGFTPLRPRDEPRAFRIHVKDHRMRDVSPTLEVYCDGYVLSQAKRDEAEANRLAAQVYGPEPIGVLFARHEGVMYELGPEPEPDDVDARQPAVLTWADGALFFLIASDTRPAADLKDIAASLYV